MARPVAPAAARGSAMPMRRALRAVASAMVALAALLGSGAARADDAQALEYRVKAGFLYNFARLVEWPDSAFDGPAAPFSVCVVGAPAFSVSSQALAGKSVKGRRVEVRAAQGAADAAGCQLVFVSAAAGVAVPELLRALDRHVLKVGEAADFLRHGGTINLVRHDNRVRFEIVPAAVAGTHALRFGSQLLKLAIVAGDDL